MPAHNIDKQTYESFNTVSLQLRHSCPVQQSGQTSFILYNQQYYEHLVTRCPDFQVKGCTKLMLQAFN